ncbi:MAG: super-infection exclusion protein B [Henriciella sp.]|uniref:super-infection exclusion protein B n=1 Tax=Henriciella sp. TaxID=1968823 RepID=UPI0032EA956F
MPSLKDFVSALQAGWFPALAALVGCAIIIAGDYYQLPYLSDTPDFVLSVIVIVAVFSASILIANFVYLPIEVFKTIKRSRLREKYKKQLIEEIQNASDTEKAILAYLISSNRKAFTAEFNDRRLAPLVSKGLIIKLGGTHTTLDWPYLVQDDVWAYLKENVHLFQMDVSELSDPFDWRTGLW